VAGAEVGGSQAPGSVGRLLSCSAATTRPALALTCSAMTVDPRMSLARDWTTMPCGGTVIPISEPASRGMPSVRALTCTSAGWLSTFIR